MNVKRMAAIVVAMLLLAYPLSIGPVLRMHLEGSPKPVLMISESVLTFYGPLMWVGKFKPIGKVIDWYCNLWVPDSVPKEVI